MRFFFFSFFFAFLLLLSSCSSDTTSSEQSTVLLFLTITDTSPGKLDPSLGNPSNTVRSAISTDGYTFTLLPEPWITHSDMADPAVALGNDNFWMVASGTFQDSVRYTYATPCPSFDSSSFSEITKQGGVPDIFVLPEREGYRIYYSANGGIRSMFSSDGINFTEEAGLRLNIGDVHQLSVIADPAVTLRTDGTYVLYFKGIPKEAGIVDSPYYHNVYRATSPDGLTFTAEETDTPLLLHASVPGAYTDANGKVWVYYLNFAEGWPEEHETVWATYEQEDTSLVEPQEVTFTPSLAAYEFVNDPDPLLLPESYDFSACSTDG